MKKGEFRGIEGARALLAWTVVISHILFVAGTYIEVHPLWHVINAGHWAVCTFIIISGFVITHIVLVRREFYSVYLVRRVFRIYPAYLACLAAGIITTPLALETFATVIPSATVFAVDQARELASGHFPYHL